MDYTMQNPMAFNFVDPSTFGAPAIAPPQQSDQQKQEALIAALRGLNAPQQQQSQGPVQMGRVTPVGNVANGMDFGGIAKAFTTDGAFSKFTGE